MPIDLKLSVWRLAFGSLDLIAFVSPDNAVGKESKDNQKQMGLFDRIDIVRKEDGPIFWSHKVAIVEVESAGVPRNVDVF